MKFKISALLLLFSFGFIFTSCEKDDEVTPQDVKGLLTSKTWTYNGASHSDPIANAFAALLDAIYDGGTYTFNADGNYSATLQGISGSGTWTLSEDEKTLTLDGGDEVYTLTISSSSMTWEDAEGYKIAWK